jgi:hypothetical protein
MFTEPTLSGKGKQRKTPRGRLNDFYDKLNDEQHIVSLRGRKPVRGCRDVKADFYSPRAYGGGE